MKNILELIGRENPFPNAIHGKDWMLGFCQRWKHRLSLRKPEYLTVARVKGATEESHLKFMQLVDNLLIPLGIKDKPKQLYNCDDIVRFSPLRMLKNASVCSIKYLLV